MKPCAVLDTETSGLDPKIHSVLEIAISAYDSDSNQVLGTYQAYINHPDLVADPRAMAVNKISMKDLTTMGKPPEVVCVEIAAFLKKHFGSKLVTPIGHNTPFDIGFIQPMFKEAGVKYPLAYRYLDTCAAARFLVAAHVLPETKCTLGGLITLLGVPSDPEKFHGAAYDVEMTLELFRTLTALLKK